MCNKIAAGMSLLGDVLKGVLAVVIARIIGTELGSASLFAAWAAVAVFLGHLYPVFLKFKGGKGVATALGVLAALHPLLALLAALCWLLVAYTTRYSSLSAIITALIIPVIYMLGAGHLWAGSQARSEEHTSELQSRGHLVCRLLLEKKKNKNEKKDTQSVEYVQ